MGVKRLIITPEPKTFHFALPKYPGVILKLEIFPIIKHNELLAEYTMKNKIRQLLCKYEHGNDIHEHAQK